MLFCPFFYRSLSLVAMEGLSMYVGGCIFGPSTALRLENQPTFCVFFFRLCIDIVVVLSVFNIRFFLALRHF